jgi:hypothetical protein
MTNDYILPLPGRVVIITRHTVLVQWLAQKGITGPVYEQVVVDREPTGPLEVHVRDLQGAHVIGVLPLWLAAAGPSLISEVAMPRLPLEARKRLGGGDYTIAEMDSWGAGVKTYLPPREIGIFPMPDLPASRGWRDYNGARG